MKMKLLNLLTVVLLIGLLISCVKVHSPNSLPELEWVENGSHRWADLPIAKSDDVGFEEIPSSVTGITFNNYLSDKKLAENRVLLNGSGVAAGDVTGNGYIDLYFSRLDGPNKLYENIGGFRFKDITDYAGVAHEGYQSTGAVFADINGNGVLDLLVTSLDKNNTLYINDGNGSFKKNENSGLGFANGSSTMALADITGNGYLDLYITNYKKKSPRDLFDFQKIRQKDFINEKSILSPFNEYYNIVEHGDIRAVREIGERDDFYLNNGNGTFRKVEDLENYFFKEDGSPLGLYPDWGLTAKFQDLNGNGLQDLYVANDFWTPDRIWINQGDGTFHALDTLGIRNSSYSSMAVDFSDVNRNGNTDIFVVEMLSRNHQHRMLQAIPDEPLTLTKGKYINRPRYNRNSFFLNRGDKTFIEISYFAGLQASEWSWATRFVDLNLNGYEDIIVATGFKFDLQDMDAQQQASHAVSVGELTFNNYVLGFPPLYQQNKLFRNNGNLTFSDVSEEWGFTSKDISHGMIVADLDNDGDLDLVINRMNDEAAVFRNKSSEPRIAIRLVGANPNSKAIGAKVELFGGPVNMQNKQVSSGGDYVSDSDQLLVFAAELDNLAHSLMITWPDGSQSRLDSLRANRIYEIREMDISKLELPDENEITKFSIFQDISEHLNHTHHEDPFDDFRIQTLLPYRLSQLGPGVALIDLTGDGRDELLIGTGKGGNLDVYTIDNDLNFRSLDIGQAGGRSSGDQSGIIGWQENDFTHVVVGLANYEIGTEDVPSALHLMFRDGEVVSGFPIPGISSTTGPIAASDYTGNGAIDLFIGGRFLPGQYPMDATSRLFRNRENNFIEDTDNNPLFENLGLVTGAVFIDFNLNGHQDLIVTTEWGTVRIFENNDGTFNERTSELGLKNYSGWWQGIATGDFTGNGYPDLVISNKGRNSQYQIKTENQPLKLFFQDPNDNGIVNIFDSYYDHVLDGYVPRRQLQEYRSIQQSLGNIRSHRLFSQLTIQNIFGLKPDQIPHKHINTLEHMVFINLEGKGFKANPLPAKAQFSAGFYVGVADMDNDGHEDIFMSQNFFAVTNPQQQPRIDGGRGLWLKGDGTGKFKAIPGDISGIKVYGEQRGAALGDFNNDGKVDVIVSQNAAKTKVYVNEADQRGVRVKVIGPANNLTGIGASIRIVYNDGSKGPNRYIHAGSGYLSQNSSTQVLGLNGNPAAIKVRWADGTVQFADYQEGKMNYEIIYSKN